MKILITLVALLLAGEIFGQKEIDAEAAHKIYNVAKNLDPNCVQVDELSGNTDPRNLQLSGSCEKGATVIIWVDFTYREKGN